MHAALPMAEQRRELPVTALFLASSALVALTAGFALGAWLLFHASLGVPLPTDRWAALVQVHGHAQLIGFAGLLIMGIGYRVFPRFRGAASPPTGAVIASFALVATALALRSALLWSDAPERSLLLIASGTFGLAGALVYATIVLDVLSKGQSPHRADEVLIGLGAVSYPIGAAWALVALMPAMSGAPAADPRADMVSVAILLFGFVASHVLGVSLRVAPAFIAAPPAPARLVVAGAVLWYVGVLAATFSSAVGPLALLAGGLVLVHAVGPFRTSTAPRPLPAPARVTRLAFRAGYAWLVAGLALLAVASLSPWPLAGAATAARHALALGFLMSIVFGVGARLVPALTGGTAIPAAALRTALLLTNAAALLRVTFELIGPAERGATIALAASGVLAYAALVVFVLAAGRSVRSAIRGFA